MGYIAVFVLSLASLSYEVLLPRIFSFTQWHHLSFFVISVVVFGFGASGSLLVMRDSGLLRRPASAGRLGALSLLYSLSAAGSCLFLLRVPLDYFLLPVQLRQGGYLAATYLILLLPFFFAGAALSLSFAAQPERSGWIYAASMLGSACGALAPALLLPRFGEVRPVLGGAALAALVGALAALAPSSVEGRRLRLLLASGSALAAALFAWLAVESRPFLELKPSPYKTLAQALQFQGTRLLGTQNALRGRLDRLASPALRFIPGMSLAFAGTLPERELLLVDGDGLYQAFALDDASKLAFSQFTTSFAAYQILETPRRGQGRVLILLEGGGLSLPCAVSSGARSVRALVRHPGVARFFQENCRKEGVEFIAANPRGYLARDRELYDILCAESWGPSVPGVASLAQEHLFTVDAFLQYLRHLAPDGIFSVSRRIQLPPSDCLRLFASAFTALGLLGEENPDSHIAMIRSWDSYTLLVARRPFSGEQLLALRSFCSRLSFDPLYYRGLAEADANRFNVYEQPYHYRELQALSRALVEGRPEGYYGRYLLDVSPTSDDRPFQNRFTKWLRIGALYRATGSRLYSLLLSGEVVLLAVLGLALALGVLLLLLPRLGRRGGRPALGPPAFLYFLACGAGYMFIEMGFIHDFTFLFGDPVVAVSVALAGLLVCSGVGGAVSAGWRRRGLLAALAELSSIAILLLIFRRPALTQLLRLPGIWQIILAVLFLAPAGLLAGVPFPVGLRLAERGPGGRAYAWAVNGVASVLASVLALPLAMSGGIFAVFLAGGLCYLAAIVSAMLRGGILAGAVSPEAPPAPRAPSG